MKKLIYTILAATILILSGCANAGKDQKVESGNEVVLDGSGSTTNVGGKITTYKWEQISGKKVELSSNNSATTTFIAPDVKEKSDLVFKLTTIETGGKVSKLVSSDRVTVTVLPKSSSLSIKLKGPKVYILKQYRDYVDPGVEISGSSSYTYKTIGNVVSNTIGDYKITYIAEDDKGNTAKVSRVVKVRKMDVLIKVNKISPEAVTLEPYGSFFEVGDKVVSYKWYILRSLISTEPILERSFTPGQYTIALEVESELGNKSFKFVTINIESKNQNLKLVRKTGQKVSYDKDGKIVTDGSVKDDGYYQKGIDAKFIRDAEKEIVTDTLASIQWQDNDELDNLEPIPWLDAEKYCKNLTLDGQNWRLPTIEELSTLVDYSKKDILINDVFVHRFTNTKHAGFWSSNIPGENSAWVIYFEYGTELYSIGFKRLYVRCVRDITKK